LVAEYIFFLKTWEHDISELTELPQYIIKYDQRVLT